MILGFLWALTPPQGVGDPTFSSLTLTPFGLAVVQDDGPVWLVHPSSLRRTGKINTKVAVNDVAWSDATRTLAVLGEDSVSLVSLPLRKVRISIPIRASIAARTLAFSTDGMRFAVGSDDGWVRSYDASSGSVEARFKFRSPVMSLAYSADSKLLAGGCGNQIRIVDLGTRRILYSMDPAPGIIQYAYSVRFGSDGSLAASLSDGTVRLLDAGRRKSRRIGTKGKAQCVGVEFLRSGLLAAIYQPGRAGAAEDNALATFEAKSGRRLSRQTLPGRPVDLVVSSDRQHVYVLLQDGRVLIRAVPGFEHRLSDTRASNAQTRAPD